MPLFARERQVAFSFASIGKYGAIRKASGLATRNSKSLSGIPSGLTNADTLNLKQAEVMCRLSYKNQMALMPPSIVAMLSIHSM